MTLAQWGVNPNMILAQWGETSRAFDCSMRAAGEEALWILGTGWDRFHPVFIIGLEAVHSLVFGMTV